MGNPELLFPHIQDEELDYILWEIKMKQWCEGVVQFANGERMNVTFVTPLRATQEIEGTPLPCYSEPHLLIVPDTELATMQKAVEYAYKRGIFSRDPDTRPI